MRIFEGAMTGSRYCGGLLRAVRGFRDYIRYNESVALKPI